MNTEDDMAKGWQSAAVMAAMVAASGCLAKDETNTWYLDAAGSVTWSVIEKDVRSDADTAADRAREESTYIDAVRAGTHPKAQAFEALDAREVRAQIVRAVVPFTVVTHARFDSLAALGQGLLQRMGLAGTSVMTREGPIATWTLSARNPHRGDAEPASDNDVSFDKLSVVLVTGRFVSAEGFTLGDGGRIATLVEPDGDPFKDGGTLVLRLTWRP
jgi:hypothetical protein